MLDLSAPMLAVLVILGVIALIGYAVALVDRARRRDAQREL